MGKCLSTFYAESNKGKAEVHMNYKEEYAHIEYFDSNDKRFFIEEFPNKTLRYVEDAAENWSLGIKKLHKID